MTVPGNSFFALHAHRIQEVLSRKISVFLPGLDEVWDGMIASNLGVVPVDQLSRDWVIHKTYMSGLAGVIRPGGPRGDWTLYGDKSGTTQLGPRLYNEGVESVFPDPTEGVNPLPFRLTVPLRSIETNLMLSLHELTAEVTPAFIGEVVEPKLRGFARYLSQVLCLYFYLSQNSHYALTSAGTGSISYSDSNRTVTLDLTKSNYAVDRFMVGMQVQFYSSDGNTLRRNGNTGDSLFVVTAVDELSGRVSFKSFKNQDLSAAQGGGSSFSATFVVGDIVVLAASKGDATTPFSGSPYFTGIAGLNSWMKFGTGPNDAFLLGAERHTGPDGRGSIDVRTFPEFKSMLVNNGGQPLTEHRMRLILRRWHSAKNKYGQTIDTLIASDGVWLAYEATRIAREYYDRTGRLSSLENEGSRRGFSFTCDGRTYDGHTSTYVEANTVYGIKRKGNWKIVAPPTPKGVVKDRRQAGWVPFVFVSELFAGRGHLPIYIVSNNRTLLSGGVQMPGYLRMQVVPEQPAGIKITNVAEDRVYSA